MRKLERVPTINFKVFKTMSDYLFQSAIMYFPICIIVWLLYF